ncbi:MAG TPA: NPCBM/NEW2 domain-containing protein [Candidatus Binatia bacterium]|jgi:alpha-galactosidase|nr:NPCBM/NEW2 domain-containing protein [Candidatus Binatia bacterium]
MLTQKAPLTAALASFTLAGAAAAATFGLETLDLQQVEQEWGQPHANQSVEGHPLLLGGQRFEHGLGTHATSTFRIALGGKAERFTAVVGADDEVEHRGSITFRVVGDGKTLWESGVMRGGDPAKHVAVDLHGIKTLVLSVGDAGDGIDHDHGDWADAQIVMTEGKPQAFAPPREPAVVLTPKSSPQPRINGAKLFGVRPGSPFLFTIPASGQRPIAFAADNLPSGLQLDPLTGRITGVLKEKGSHLVTLHAKNASGSTQREFKIVCGDTIALTPPLGWNSWNGFGCDVKEANVRAAADAMVASGLINHGWTYINIDDCWEAGRDGEGNVQSNPKFPDMKALADYVHGKGLKIGLYSSPGPTTCAGHEGSYKHEEQDARRYAEWGFDYLKYDWCSYGGIKPRPNHEELLEPYQVMRAALAKAPRDIVFSLCQYGMGNVWEWGAQVGGNCWRTTGDISDTWSSMSGIGFGQAGHEKFAGPGHWNDPDMLVVGYVGWSAKVRPTRLSPNEQYTHISLWCLLCSPLLIGCDMTRLDDFTLNLLTNDEVLDVNQDPLGRQAGRVAKEDSWEVWAKELEDGSKAVGLFNRGEDEAMLTANWAHLGLTGKQVARDLWRQKDLGTFNGQFQISVPRHGVVLVKLTPAR